LISKRKLQNLFILDINPEGIKIIKIFSLLLASTIITHIAAWGLNWKFGETNWHYYSKAISYSDLLSPIKDLSYFEHFQYILILWCGTLSLYWSIVYRKLKAISISFIYFYLFLDDAIGVHDRIIRSNEMINQFFSKYNYLFSNNQDFIDNLGEYTYWLVVLVIALSISLPGFLSNSKITRKFMIINFILYAGLSFFAIIVDFVGLNWDKLISIDSRNLEYLIRVAIEIIEECGEIGIFSLSCIWLFALNFSTNNKVSTSN